MNPKRKFFLTGTFLVLDDGLGEESAALDVQHIEVGQLPERQERNKFLRTIKGQHEKLLNFKGSDKRVKTT